MVLQGYGRRLLGSSFEKTMNIHKSILFSQNNNPVKRHSPRRETTAVHCTTLYKSVGNPGHSSRSLRNHISFAMQIVVPTLPSEIVRAETGTPECVCWHGPPWGALGPPWGPRPQPRPQAARFIGFGAPGASGRRQEPCLRQVVGASGRRQELPHRVVVI